MNRVLIIFLLLIAGMVSCPRVLKGAEQEGEPASTEWRGVHLLQPAHAGMSRLKRAIAEELAPLGINALVLEINYQFQYRSHPELGSPEGLSHDDARELADLCRRHKIRVIPQFNCLGHQSWRKNTFPLLIKYPEFDETPDTPLDNPGIYCRSWCPSHPRVNEVVFSLIDELVDAFQADAVHVGMDEVFIVASDQCPRCRGKDPAEVFAKAVNDLHLHIVGEKRLTMLMWGDRLLDDKTMHYGKWEASANGTAGAIDRIPKNLILCDWHYEPRDSYPSVHYFQNKGFRVWPSSWKNEKAALAMLNDARKGATERMIGHLCTTWAGADDVMRALLREDEGRKLSENATEAASALVACMKALGLP